MAAGRDNGLFAGRAAVFQKLSERVEAPLRDVPAGIATIPAGFGGVPALDGKPPAAVTEAADRGATRQARVTNTRCPGCWKDLRALPAPSYISLSYNCTHGSLATMMKLPMQLGSMMPRPNLARDAAELLSRSIRDGSLSHGDRLPSESEIARKLGVSRPVVREAIAYLKAEGIVASRRGLGLFVNRQETLRLRVADIEASEQSILEFLEFRLGLEVEAAQLAALRHTADDIARMDAALVRLQEADEAGHDSSEHDLAFHLAIAEAAQNPLFSKVLTFVSGPLLKSIRAMREKDAGARVHVEIRHEDHGRIFERIRSSDPVGAADAMRDHIDESYRRYASGMSNGGLNARPHPAIPGRA